MLTAREYAKIKGVKLVGKLKMSYESYGMDKKQKVWTDDGQQVLPRDQSSNDCFSRWQDIIRRS